MAAIEVDIPQLSPVPTPTNTTLAEDGDVILILWHESILHERIRVSSAILSAASPVFKAMLGPHFQEGQQARSAERPREIELPEDGAYGMEIMLQWLHGNVDEAFGDDGHPCCVAHVAVHLDKYGCPRSFSLIGEALLKRCAEACTARCSGDDEELFETVAWSAKAAYLLKSSDLFTQFTRRLILDGTEPFSNIPKLAAGEQMLSDGSRVRAYSGVLHLASKKFKKMLGQAPRSATDPQIITFLDDDPEALKMLLRGIHLTALFGTQGWSFSKAASSLASLGAVAAKYRSYYALRPAAEAIMLRGVNTMSMVSLSVDETMIYYAQYSAAAYHLGMPRLFSHYTRRLVLDATSSFTEIQVIEGCSGLPTSVICKWCVLAVRCSDADVAYYSVGLEEQRSSLREELIATITARTNGKCQTPGCPYISPSSAFPAHATRRLAVPHWPPPWGSTTIRTLLQGLMHTGDINLGQTFPMCQHKNNPLVISQKALTIICKTVEGRARGLCLICAEKDETQSRCEHVQDGDFQLKDWIV
ncbi:hypothetical protein LTR10_005748 [Elasticomyces elasticus]|nr:hypothetical protein LTR10_005748 [Elasticomyces elasticus]KAK4964956.1 hypothetical protein LTR42_012373 [Elasticomyces elasticus]